MSKTNQSNIFQEASDNREAYETAKEEMTDHKTAWEKSRQKVWDILGPPPETGNNNPFSLNLPKIKKEHWWWIIGIGAGIFALAVTVTPIILIVLVLIIAGLFAVYKGNSSGNK